MELPPTLKRIEYSAFEGCAHLKEVQFPAGLETIGRWCFYESGLEKAVLPSSVKNVCVRAFSNCKNLRTVRLNEGLEVLGAKEVLFEQEVEGGVFLESALESVTIPSTLKVIETNTFAKCWDLRKVTVSEGVEKICRKAFRESGLEEVELPSTLTQVANDAF